MRFSTQLGFVAGVALAGGILAAPAHAQQAVKTDLPDSLTKLAKVDESTARATAVRRVPSGNIQAVELERESGHLQYSYDVKVPGKSGITEVNVDAMSGKVLGVHRESAATETKETAAEKKPGSP